MRMLAIALFLKEKRSFEVHGKAVEGIEYTDMVGIIWSPPSTFLLQINCLENGQLSIAFQQHQVFSFNQVIIGR